MKTSSRRDAAGRGYRGRCVPRVRPIARRSGVAALALIFLAVASGCATRDPWQDARIESEVKARLVGETDMNLTRLGVVSRQAVVRLSGTVSSADEKARAESVARAVAGVRRVVNEVDVRPEPRS